MAKPDRRRVRCAALPLADWIDVALRFAQTPASGPPIWALVFVIEFDRGVDPRPRHDGPHPPPITRHAIALSSRANYAIRPM